jgi:transcriptional regulator with XRE-family HTH domain
MVANSERGRIAAQFRSEFRIMNSERPPGIAGRLKAVVDAAGGPSKVGQAASINRVTLANWCNGKSEPGLSDAQKLAAVLGVDVNFLAAWESPMRVGEAPAVPEPAPVEPSGVPTPPVDPEFFGLVFEKVSRTYADLRVKIGPRALGIAAAEIYADVTAASAPGTAERTGALAMGLAQLRRRLLTPRTEDGHSKRQA